MFVSNDIILVSSEIVNRKQEYSAELQLTCRGSGIFGTKQTGAVTEARNCIYYITHRTKRTESGAPNSDSNEKTLRGEAGGLYQGWFQKRAESRNPIYVFL